MKIEERKNRIIARGEHSNHSHVVVGDAQIQRDGNGNIEVSVGNEGAILRHILESNWIQGEEVWTGEHKDVELEPNKTYNYIQQQEYDWAEDVVRQVID